MTSLVTWNVNSIRVRLEQVIAWLTEHQPDVLVLQEIKIVDELFPRAEIEALGYHVTVFGQPTYNGVAILSRQAPQDIVMGIPNYDDIQKRVLAATIAGIRVICIYVPNGASVDSDKYEYKLQWFSQLLRYVQMTLQHHEKVVILGDYNIAPHDIDVHDPKVWQGQVLVSDKERACFQHLLELGLSDAFRVLNPDAAAYSWWDYRLNAFKRNLGLRIDHILATKAVLNKAIGCEIDKTPRTWERPSDHTPVILRLED